MKITQARMAQIANVTTRTIINWEKEKPELIKIIKKGIEADNNYKEFFKLFEPYKFWSLHNFYLDFYFRFLNYFRTNITLQKANTTKFQSTDINSTAIIYLIEKHKSELFDQSLNINELDLENFQREAFQKPLFHVNEELSTYILKNTLDGFGTLVNDALYKDETLFKESLNISITYLIYMFYPYKNKKEKSEMKEKIYKNELNIERLELNKEIDHEKTYKKYLDFKKKFFIENIDQIDEEWILYSDNNFYVPGIVEIVNKYYEKY